MNGKISKVMQGVASMFGYTPKQAKRAYNRDPQIRQVAQNILAKKRETNRAKVLRGTQANTPL